jgi:hypothetical protein
MGPSNPVLQLATKWSIDKVQTSQINSKQQVNNRGIKKSQDTKIKKSGPTRLSEIAPAPLATNVKHPYLVYFYIFCFQNHMFQKRPIILYLKTSLVKSWFVKTSKTSPFIYENRKYFALFKKRSYASNATFRPYFPEPEVQVVEWEPKDTFLILATGIFWDEITPADGRRP